MNRCTVCGSANLNKFYESHGDGPLSEPESPAWWCEDCGSMHNEMGVSCPEKSMLHHQVTAFHKKFGQPIAARPHVPSEVMVRFRLKLIAEEFFELLEAALDDPTARLDLLHGHVRELINDDALDVDLPMFVDALGDMDYISEGTRLVFGVDGRAVAEEIQRANMSKEAAIVDATLTLDRSVDVIQTQRLQGSITATVKPTKPEGWTPPDIDRVLIEQGWKP